MIVFPVGVKVLPAVALGRGEFHIWLDHRQFHIHLRMVDAAKGVFLPRVVGQIAFGAENLRFDGMG